MPDVVRRVRALVSGDFIRHGLIVFVATSLVNAFGYAFHFAISRKVGVEQYGELSALNATILFSLLVPQIVSSVLVKTAAELHAAGDEGRLARLTRVAVRYGWYCGAALLAVLLACAWPLATFLKIGDVRVVIIAMLVLVATTVVASLRGFYLAVDDFNGYAYSAVLESALKMGLGVGLVYAGFGLVGAFGGWAAATLTSLVFTAITVLLPYRRVENRSLGLDPGDFAKTMTGVAAGNALLAALGNFDVIVVKHFADPTTAGLYGALALAGKILFFFVSFVPLVVLPKATKLALEGRSPTPVLVQALGVVAGVSGAGLVFYFAFPQLVVTLLAGQSFAPAAPYVFAYGIAMVFLALLGVIVAYKIGIHRFDFVAPLCAVTVAEVVGIALRHDTLHDVISVLILGNITAVVFACWRITAPAQEELPASATDAA